MNNDPVWVEGYYDGAPLYPDHRAVSAYRLHANKTATAQRFNEPGEASNAKWQGYLDPKETYVLFTKENLEQLGFECHNHATVDLYLPLRFLMDLEGSTYDWNIGPKVNDANNNPMYAMVGRTQQGNLLSAASAQHLNTVPKQKILKDIIDKQMCDWHIFDDPKAWFRSVDKKLTLLIRPIGKPNVITPGQVTNAFRRVTAQMKCKTDYIFHEAPVNNILQAQYKLLSTSPFGLYETWIRKDEIVTEIEEDRPFPERATKEWLADWAKGVYLKAGKDKKDPVCALGLSPQEFLVQVKNGAQEATKLDPDKIEAAAGKRGEVQSQKTAMGGLSATDLTDIFKWTAAKPPGLAKAEWLHVVAFSFGGVGQGDNYHLSQLSSNFIFGTSECNSVMLRYEGIWQVLYKYEAALRKLSPAHNQTKPRGFVQATINDGLWVEPLNRLGGYPWRFDNEAVPVELSQVFPWLCYAMRYRINMDYCLLFGMDTGNELAQEVDFFPFTRPFFTKGEALADRFLLDELYYKRTTGLKEQYPQ